MKKQAQVVMLATDNKSDLQLNVIHNNLFSMKDGANIPTQPYQHLYILSDDKIEVNDYFIHGNGSLGIRKCDKITKDSYFEKDNEYFKSDCKKIIATTNSELKQNLEYINGGKCGEVCLTQIPQQFIELFITNFNQGNIITEVEVEYEEYFENNSTNKQWVSESSGRVCNNYRLYTNKNDNTINIILSVKKMYSREEVENYISLAWATCSAITYKEGESIQKDCESWISTHLK